MKEQRQELINQRRFGVDDVEEKLKEIFREELDDLTENYDVPEGTAALIKKLIDNVEPSEPLTEEGTMLIEFNFTITILHMIYRFKF